MKQDESILDVLMYLFENYIENDDDDAILDHSSVGIRQELSHVGFGDGEINKALNWLDDLGELTDNLIETPSKISPHAMRLYSADEMAKLPVEAQGFLLFMEQLEVINPDVREKVIERCMALESEELNLDELKWVLLMVLFNDSEQTENAEKTNEMIWVESLLYDETEMTLH